MFDMNLLGFSAFLLTGIGYIFKKYFEYSFEKKIKKEEYYQEIILHMRSFTDSFSSHDECLKNRNRLIELYQTGWTFLPADVLRAFKNFLDQLEKRSDENSSETAYQKLALKIREQFFTKKWFPYRILFSLENDDVNLNYDEFKIVGLANPPKKKD